MLGVASTFAETEEQLLMGLQAKGAEERYAAQEKLETLPVAASDKNAAFGDGQGIV